jgi:enhancing lycopene biosynthesis protein 2
MAARLVGDGAKCTIGNDADVASAINAMGAAHVECGVEQTVIDSDKKLVTTPAYMLAGKISEAATGIDQLVADVLAMA